MLTSPVPCLGLPGQVLSAVQRRARIVEQVPLALNTYRLRLECPDLAAQILPGQFFMVRALDRSDPLLGRPFALLDTYRDADGQIAGVDFGYLVVGKLTGLLRTLQPGDELEVWGPLGNGFAPADGGHLAIVAGGIGQTPFVAVLQEALGLKRYGAPPRSPGQPPQQVTVCYGVRSAAHLAGVEWFQHPGVAVRLATDDGSVGHHGYVTDLLRDLLQSPTPPTRVLCCGPEPMMRAVARLTIAAEVPCWLSLETPMACGFGACFSCVTPIRQDDGEWDYRRVCVEGPVFAADRVAFDAL